MYLNSPLIVPSSASSILTSAIKTNFLSLFTNNKIINENPDTSIGYNKEPCLYIFINLENTYTFKYL